MIASFCYIVYFYCHRLKTKLVWWKIYANAPTQDMMEMWSLVIDKLFTLSYQGPQQTRAIFDRHDYLLSTPYFVWPQSKLSLTYFSHTCMQSANKSTLSTRWSFRLKDKFPFQNRETSCCRRKEICWQLIR